MPKKNKFERSSALPVLDRFRMDTTAAPMDNGDISIYVGYNISVANAAPIMGDLREVMNDEEEAAFDKMVRRLVRKSAADLGLVLPTPPPATGNGSPNP